MLDVFLSLLVGVKNVFVTKSLRCLHGVDFIAGNNVGAMLLIRFAECFGDGAGEGGGFVGFECLD